MMTVIIEISLGNRCPCILTWFFLIGWLHWKRIDDWSSDIL